MPLLLDTTILSTHIKRPDLTFTRFITHGGQLRTSQVVIGELYAWAYLAKTAENQETRMKSIENLRSEVEVLQFDDECSRKFGELKVRIGTAAGSVDLMIVATSIVHNAVIVSHDKDFFHLQRMIPELHVIDWLEG